MQKTAKKTNAKQENIQMHVLTCSLCSLVNWREKMQNTSQKLIQSSKCDPVIYISELTTM